MSGEQSAEIARWRKRPVEVDAVQLLDDIRNHIAVIEWIKAGGGEAFMSPLGSHITIVTLEGNMTADLGDYVIRGVQGEHYPCKPDIFEAAYEAATPPESPGEAQ